jgi:pimeloyl-ACP methyl ester carboxylesterase
MKITSFTSKDGTSIACHVTGRGAPLVLVHGATADHYRWTPLLSTLEQRFTVYAVDRRGRGASGDALGAYALDREAEDIAAIVDGLGGPVDLVGHSYGALVSLEASLRAANLRKLVLYEPPTRGAPPIPPALLDRLESLIASGEHEAAVSMFLAEGARVPAHELQLMKSLPAWPARVAAAHTIPRELRAVDAHTLDPARFTTMKAPTLLFLGGASPPSFRASLELVHAALPHAHLRVLPNQQHVAMDTAPDLFLRELLEFLTP